MRLTKFEAESIKESVYGFDPDARIILFGSRVDDTKRGGDIDLLVLSGMMMRSRMSLFLLKLW